LSAELAFPVVFLEREKKIFEKTCGSFDDRETKGGRQLSTLRVKGMGKTKYALTFEI